MRFLLERSSSWKNDDPPYPTAYQLPDRLIDEWDYNLWFIDVDSLDQLLDLTDAEGKVVVKPRSNDTGRVINTEYCTIEIYDAWRE